LQRLRRRTTDDERAVCEGFLCDPSRVSIAHEHQGVQQTSEHMWLVREPRHGGLSRTGGLRILPSGQCHCHTDNGIAIRMRQHAKQPVAEVALIQSGDIGSAAAAAMRVVWDDAPTCGTERGHGHFQAAWPLARRSTADSIAFETLF
jgi:hypothetical protein